MEWKQLLCQERIRPVKKREGSRDLRSEFEKDYHRIIGSASFRRLQDKTQVFPLDKSDFIRTRLTHSLEVSSFAKSFGQNVSARIIQEKRDRDFGSEEAAAICDILQCAGLLHDIGNPPFGHFGETIIREWFEKNLPSLMLGDRPVEDMLNDQMKADFYHFEGNTQAFRLVTKLHYLVDENGMNLTKPLLATIIKYPVSSLEIDKHSGDITTKKMGYYYADRDKFQDVEDSVGTHGRRHPLAFLLEAADDVAYKTADIEDACKKGYISYGDLLKELNGLIESSEESPIHDIETIIYLRDVLERKMSQALKLGVEHPESIAVSNWAISVQGRAIAAATDSFMEHYDEIMAGTYKFELFKGTKVETIMDLLGDMAARFVFQSKSIYKLEIAAERILGFLLDQLVPAAIIYDTKEHQTAVSDRLMALISENYKAIYRVYAQDATEEEKLYLRLLLVTDYVCGMTDSYAKSLYQELSGMD